MSWGIAETASEIEKIKSESADYLNGLNSCGVIDWNTYNYAFDFYADLLMKAYEQGREDAQPEPQWISCSERLPEKNGGYLCSLGDDTHSIEVDTFTDDHFEIYNVIAWMPLPEPYTEDADA